ncbi:MAG: redoxin domain-containing protein [Nannocystaceae bacterium]
MLGIRAPELEPALRWLNCAKPLSLAQLRGQVVLLDFWTCSSVHCIHSRAVLRELERRFRGQPFVILGVHTAKYPAEQHPARVEEAIERHGIEYPVVVDDHMQIWNRYAIRSWPTVVLIHPDGSIADAAPGEAELPALDKAIRETLQDARARGVLAERPFDFHVTLPRPTGALRFPGKAALCGDGRVAIADSGHHRVLVYRADGSVAACIGTGEPGFSDGPLATARLNDPQGLTWEGDHLWICDARNHAIRLADLERGELTTVVGTGTMGRKPLRGVTPARQRPLRSPWDLVFHEGKLYVAMAGSHQIALVDLCLPRGEPTIQPLSGSGVPGLVDGGPSEAAFAQPSGLSLSGDKIIVVDSDSSAVRCVSLETGACTTLAGRGLFEYGLVDGDLARARFQRPIGVAVARDGAIFVADTYNDCVREIDREAGTARTLYAGDGEGSLREPSDVVVTAGGDLIVVDTGHHRLVRLGRDGKLGATFHVEEVPIAPRERPSRSRRSVPVDITPIVCAPVGSGRGEMRLHLMAPDGWNFTNQNSIQLRFRVVHREDLIELAEQRSILPDDAPELVVATTVITRPADAPHARGQLQIDVDAVLVAIGNRSTWAPARGSYRLEVALTGDAPCDLDVRLPVELIAR